MLRPRARHIPASRFESGCTVDVSTVAPNPSVTAVSKACNASVTSPGCTAPPMITNPSAACRTSMSVRAWQVSAGDAMVGVSANGGEVCADVAATGTAAGRGWLAQAARNHPVVRSRATAPIRWGRVMPRIITRLLTSSQGLGVVQQDSHIVSARRGDGVELLTLLECELCREGTRRGRVETEPVHGRHVVPANDGVKR